MSDANRAAAPALAVDPLGGGGAGVAHPAGTAPDTAAPSAVFEAIPPAIDRLLVRAAREVQLLSALAPVNATAERRRMVEEVARGGHPSPRWQYAPVAHVEIRRALEEASRALDALGPSALLAAYAARARELSLEAELCAAAGTRAAGAIARRRFEPDAGVAREASALAASWLAEPDVPPPLERIASDDPDPRSLLSRLRAEVGRRRLAFAVFVHPTLAPLAATGDGVILVAPGRSTSVDDVERTVVHEIEGHALPRERARGLALSLLRIGAARGVDDQEGLALVLEARHARLGPSRRKTLAARHHAVEAMLAGATFGDVARSLVDDP